MYRHTHVSHTHTDLHICIHRFHIHVEKRIDKCPFLSAYSTSSGPQFKAEWFLFRGWICLRYLDEVRHPPLPSFQRVPKDVSFLST